MKICLINNLYQPFNRGGAEKITETIAGGLINAGHEIIIISTKPRGQLLTPESGPRVIRLNSLFYNLNKLPKPARFFWQAWNLFNFINYFKLKKILRGENCAAVISGNLMGVGYLTPLAVKS